jgi:PEP-CTERM motif
MFSILEPKKEGSDMKMRIFVLSILVLVGLGVTALPATADSSIYNNGNPIIFEGYSIDTANVTSNTVQCAGTSCTPTDLSFYTVNPIGQSIGDSVSWSFTSGEFIGVGYNSGASAIPTNLPCADNGANQLCLVTVSLSGTLAQPSSSWLNLTGLNAGVDWAISGGPSEASTCELVGGTCGPTLFNIASEAFTLSGTTTTPEPSTILLLGSGILGLGGVLRRRMMR